MDHALGTDEMARGRPKKRWAEIGLESTTKKLPKKSKLERKKKETASLGPGFETCKQINDLKQCPVVLRLFFL